MEDELKSPAFCSTKIFGYSATIMTQLQSSGPILRLKYTAGALAMVGALAMASNDDDSDDSGNESQNDC